MVDLCIDVADDRVVVVDRFVLCGRPDDRCMVESLIMVVAVAVSGVVTLWVGPCRVLVWAPGSDTTETLLPVLAVTADISGSGK